MITRGVVRIETGAGAIVERDLEGHGEVAAVLAYDAGRRLTLLVRQCRAAPLPLTAAATFLELPAGQSKNEDPVACVKREVLEETGVRLRSLERS